MHSKIRIRCDGTLSLFCRDRCVVSTADVFLFQLPSDAQTVQQTGPSRVAAVGPYIQSSTMPRGPAKQDLLIKHAYPDGTATVPHQDKSTHPDSGLQIPRLLNRENRAVCLVWSNYYNGNIILYMYF